eukprot:416582-Prorocentrum_minimum.AAC.1
MVPNGENREVSAVTAPIRAQRARLSLIILIGRRIVGSQHLRPPLVHIRVGRQTVTHYNAVVPSGIKRPVRGVGDHYILHFGAAFQGESFHNHRAHSVRQARSRVRHVIPRDGLRGRVGSCARRIHRQCHRLGGARRSRFARAGSRCRGPYRGPKHGSPKRAPCGERMAGRDHIISGVGCRRNHLATTSSVPHGNRRHIPLHREYVSPRSDSNQRGGSVTWEMHAADDATEEENESKYA